jgi:hypothetical protein
VHGATHLADEADAHVSFVRRLQGQHEDVLQVERQEHPLRCTITASPCAADLLQSTPAVRRDAMGHLQGRRLEEDSKMLMLECCSTCMPAW